MRQELFVFCVAMIALLLVSEAMSAAMYRLDLLFEPATQLRSWGLS